MNWPAFNDAVSEHLVAWQTEAAFGAVADAAGPEGLAAVEEMTAFAADQTDLWLGEAYGVAWAGVERRVRERYPDLTGSAARAIAAHAAYQWK